MFNKISKLKLFCLVFLVFAILSVNIFYPSIKEYLCENKDMIVKEVKKANSNNFQSNMFIDFIIEEEPKINNITSEVFEISVNELLYLESPTVSVSASDTWGYIGLDDNDDLNASTYYTPIIVSASNNDYELTLSWFKGNSKGTYKLQYNVFLMRYEIDKLISESSESSGIYLKDGKLMYKEATSSGKKYFIYFEETSEGYVLAGNTLINGLGDDLTNASIVLEGLVEEFVLTSDIQTITVGDIAINITIDDDAYAKTQYPVINPSDPQLVTIVKPDIRISGNGSIDLEESYVQIICTSASSTNSLATIRFDEWADGIGNETENFETSDGIIKLKLIRNGKYTIKYYVQAQDNLGQNVGDAKTLEYTISSGDVVKPEINLADNFVKESYKLGDILVLNMAGLTVSDKVTTDVEKLLETLEVKLVNNDTDESWTLENSAGNGYSYEHNFEEAGDYTLIISVRDAAGNRAEKSLKIIVDDIDTEKPVLEFKENFINNVYFLGDLFNININNLIVTDNVTKDRDILLSSIEIEILNQLTGNSWVLTGNSDDGVNYNHTLNECGNYLLTIKIHDEAQNICVAYQNFEVKKFKNYVIKFDFFNKDEIENITIKVNDVTYNNQPVYIDGRMDTIRIELGLNSNFDIQSLINEIINYNVEFTMNYLEDNKYEIVINTKDLTTNELSFTFNNGQPDQNILFISLIIAISLFIVLTIVCLICLLIMKRKKVK